MKENALILEFILGLIGLSGLVGNEEYAKKFLLPGDLKPTHYNLHLITSIDKFQLGNESTFKFDVEMQIFMHAIGNNVTEIVMNSDRSTTVREVILYRSGSKPVKLGSGNYNSTTQKLTFPLTSSVKKGESLRLDINATVQHNEYTGFIYDFYYGKKQEKRWFVYTDLQPAAARLVFPCFDEPKYKATFNVSVSIPNRLVSDGYSALSNAPKAGTKQVGNNTVIHFNQTTIPMSTYLFAVVVSDFVKTETLLFNTSHPHLRHGELTTWGKSDDLETYGGDFPQLIASALIKIYTKDFGIGYDFGKIDQVGLQGYDGAMENWGLITYTREILTHQTDDIATLIAHELAHQWFGNLVTCHWWSDIWLNEGFATYFEYFGADKIHEKGINGKDWNLTYNFIIDVVQWGGMVSDVPEECSHPLTVDVYNPDEYSLYFDHISYCKGASVIYMWRNVFGEYALEKILRYYLNSFQVGVTTPEGLLSCFDRFANESVSDLNGMKPSVIFRNWHLKAGVPIVSVRKSKENPSNYVLSQDVFRLRKETKVEEAEWTIPISYSTSENFNFNKTNAEFWLIPRKNLTIKISKPVKWIILNNQESGYYRVNYNIENWKALFTALNVTPNEIHELNRAQIMDDAHEIAKSTAFDYLEYDLVLDMMLYLQKENSHFPWKSAFKKLEFMKKQVCKYEYVYPLFQLFILDLLKGRVESSWLTQNDCSSGVGHEFEKSVISWACEMGHSSCAIESKRLLEDRKKLCAGSLDVAYCAYIRSNSDKLTWEQLWNDYLTMKDETVRGSLLRSLGCAKNNILINSLLETSVRVNNEVSRKERREMVSSVIKGNTENVKTLLHFVEENLEIVEMALRRKYIKAELFIDIAKGLATDEELSKMRKIMTGLEERRETGLKIGKITEKVISIVETNNEWQKIRSKSVSDWLISRYSSNSTKFQTFFA